jgi:hypothetical protein
VDYDDDEDIKSDDEQYYNNKDGKLRTNLNNTNNTNKSRKNSNKSILTRSTAPSKMQYKASIQKCMKERITPMSNNWITQQNNMRQLKSLQEGRLEKPDQLSG